MDDDVGPQVEWSLEQRRGQGVVDRDGQPKLVGTIDQGGQVSDRQQRIGRRFEPQQPPGDVSARAGRDLGADGQGGIGIGGIGDPERQPPSLRPMAQQQPCPGVRAGSDHHPPADRNRLDHRRVAAIPDPNTSARPPSKPPSAASKASQVALSSRP